MCVYRVRIASGDLPPFASTVSVINVRMLDMAMRMYQHWLKLNGHSLPGVRSLAFIGMGICPSRQLLSLWLLEVTLLVDILYMISFSVSIEVDIVKRAMTSCLIVLELRSISVRMCGDPYPLLIKMSPQILLATVWYSMSRNRTFYQKCMRVFMYYIKWFGVNIDNDCDNKLGYMQELRRWVHLRHNRIHDTLWQKRQVAYTCSEWTT